LFVHVDPNGHVPIYLQIIQQVKNAAAAGLLAPGDKLPSVRELSKQIGINPNTLARAYQELERDGVIETIRGVGTFLCSGVMKISDQQRKEKIVKILRELFTEAYHLQYDKDELGNIIRQELEAWNSARKGEGSRLSEDMPYGESKE